MAAKTNLVDESRRAEYEAIKEEVDARAKRMTREELDLPEGEWRMGACHTYWAHKKRILKDEYNIDWLSPADLHPDMLFD